MAVESFALSVLEKQEQEEVGLVVVVKKDFVGLKVWREWKFGVWIVRAEIAIVLWSLYIVTLFWIALSYLKLWGVVELFGLQSAFEWENWIWHGPT